MTPNIPISRKIRSCTSIELSVASPTKEGDAGEAATGGTSDGGGDRECGGLYGSGTLGGGGNGGGGEGAMTSTVTAVASGWLMMVRPFTRENQVLSMVETGVLSIIRDADSAADALGKITVATMLTLPGDNVSLTSLASLNVRKSASRKPCSSNEATSPPTRKVARTW